MTTIEIYYPHKLVFGVKSLEKLTKDIQDSGLSRLYIITIPPVKDKIFFLLSTLETKGISIKIHSYSKEEPTFTDFKEVLEEAREFKADGIIGIGGGSVLDLAKLAAALLKSNHAPESVVGIGLINERKTYLVCIPTTSGTGSEVSPNSILMDEQEKLKKGIISPFLVPDIVYVDPELTVSLPSNVTAFTGIDALTHCIEAYTNKFAHPVIDNLALEGIRLIAGNLQKAVINGKDLEARSNLALGSMYGGMCLGPVNTAAVHALAYPLGSYFKIAHGISNALMLPYVMEFSMPAAIKRYAAIARAMGIVPEQEEKKTAEKGIAAIRNLIEHCGLPATLSDVGIKDDDVDIMAESAIKVQRLLKNHVPELTLNDIKEIYKKAI